MSGLLQPKEITITCQDGKEKVFVISKIPAMDAREIFCQYAISSLPKIGEYKVNEDMALKLLSYVAVPMKDGQHLRLTTRALVNNHIPDWETGFKVEHEIAQYNCSFFLKDTASSFLDVFKAMVTEKITEILTRSLQPSSPTARQP